MRHRLPTLSALRAFEAAGRHESMTLAGEELSVSAGAVSRHVGLLEAHFGEPLFHRRQHGLELTDKGRHFYLELAAAFDRIDSACDYLLGPPETGLLRVRIFTTFATEWLLPRLPQFQKQFPDIELSLRMSWRRDLSEIDEVDVVVMNTKLEGAGLHHDRLFSPVYFPVCSPQLLDAESPLKSPADLTHHTLLHTPSQTSNWRAWLDAAGVSEIDLGRGLSFDNSSLSYKAARAGAGVALGQKLFVASDLEAGNLVAPFELAVQSENSYYLICHARRMDMPHIKSFRDWFTAEVEGSVQSIQQEMPDLAPNVVQA